MVGCCGHFSALFRSKNESDLLFFHDSRLAIRAGCGGGLLGVCWSCLLRSSSPFFFPCREVKLLLDSRGRGVKRRRMVRRTKAPALRAPACNFHTCHIRQQWEGATPTGTADPQHAGPHHTWQESPLQVKGHHLHPPQDANLQPLSYLHKFGSTGWI